MFQGNAFQQDAFQDQGFFPVGFRIPFPIPGLGLLGVENDANASVSLSTTTTSAYSITATPGEITISVSLASTTTTLYAITAQPGEITGTATLSEVSSAGYDIVSTAGAISPSVSLAATDTTGYTISAVPGAISGYPDAISVITTAYPLLTHQEIGVGYGVSTTEARNASANVASPQANPALATITVASLASVAVPDSVNTYPVPAQFAAVALATTPQAGAVSRNVQYVTISGSAFDNSYQIGPATGYPALASTSTVLFAPIAIAGAVDRNVGLSGITLAALSPTITYEAQRRLLDLATAQAAVFTVTVALGPVTGAVQWATSGISAEPVFWFTGLTTYLEVLKIWVKDGGTVFPVGDRFYQVVQDGAYVRFIRVYRMDYPEKADKTRRWDGWYGPFRRNLV